LGFRVEGFWVRIEGLPHHQLHGSHGGPQHVVPGG